MGRKLILLGWLVAIALAAHEGLCMEATPATLSALNQKARPGDVIKLQGGVYAGPISPGQSGKPGKPIVYQAVQGATPVFRDQEVAISFKGRSHIQIKGIRVENCKRFLWLESSSHITIEGCHFENSSGWESCKLKTMGDSFSFLNNTVRNGSDLLTIQGGSHHRIEGNEFYKAGHTCLVFMGVHKSVIRGNRFENPIQKLLEIFATRKREWKGPHRKSEHILIERNLFGPNGHGKIYKKKEPPASWGVQFAGVKCILRRNVFAGCGGGMDFTGYDGGRDAPEAHFNYNNRVYHNTLYGNGQKGRYGSGPGILLAHSPQTQFFDNVFVNNILYRNRIFKDAHTRRDGPSVQIAIRSPAKPSEARFWNNLIASDEGKDRPAIWISRKDKGFTVEAYQTQHPEYAGGNTSEPPQFKRDQPDLKKLNWDDYALKKASPGVDAGRPLSFTVDKGSGKSVRVVDPLFFSDGFGVVEGDVVRIGGKKARISKVDYDKRVLTLAKSLDWEDRAPICLDYRGKAPDVGAVESH